MKKASNVLLRVGLIVSIVYAVIFILFAILFTVFGQDFVKEFIIEESSRNGGEAKDAEIASSVLQATSIVCAAVFYYLGVMAAINAIVAKKALEEPNQKNYVLNIVFGVLSGVEVNLVGAIFGLIVSNRE